MSTSYLALLGATYYASYNENVPITIRKRTITDADIVQIQATVDAHWSQGRKHISKVLCRQWPLSELYAYKALYALRAGSRLVEMSLRLGENWLHPIRRPPQLLSSKNTLDIIHHIICRGNFIHSLTGQDQMAV